MKNLLNQFNQSKLSQRMERRAEQRHLSHLSILVNQHEHSLFATVVNFSESGLGMIVPNRFLPNEPFELELAINQEQPLKVLLEVRSSTVIEDGFFIGAQLPESCKKYAQFFKQMSQPRFGIVTSDH
ncbi:MAG: hypothetical protein ISEC1_P1657 [Thiomicrorhabdus sp.]|nr:MAG: hypothetical protein ISEC1_P1657 [Thiomicrorhabdus sp.]